jgi:hypothetical protein
MAMFKCILAVLLLATTAATDPVPLGTAQRLLLATAAVTDPVLLGTAGDFAILTESGISTVPPSSITGHIGVSPIAATAITGFVLTPPTSNSTSEQVSGHVYASDYNSPTPSKMTTAVGDMHTAYTGAAGRLVVDGAKQDFKGGLIAGETLTAGVYKWGSGVEFDNLGPSIDFDSDIFINGTSTDVFIFQTTGNVVAAAGARVNLIPAVDGSDDKPLASNIFWQVAGYVDAGEKSHLEGVFLVKTQATFKTGSSLNGRILAQTACTLDSATITQP